MLNNLITIEKSEILEKVNNMKFYHYRFVSLTCENENDIYELTYHFDMNYKMKHLRTAVLPKDTIDSISKIYPSAFLIENEYQDLYGFTFSELSIDYKGRLYLTPASVQKPLLKTVE